MGQNSCDLLTAKNTTSYFTLKKKMKKNNKEK